MRDTEDAAIRAVCLHLSRFGDSSAAETLWEDNPQLTEAQGIEAAELADLIVRSIIAGIEAQP